MENDFVSSDSDADNLTPKSSSKQSKIVSNNLENNDISMIIDSKNDSNQFGKAFMSVFNFFCFSKQIFVFVVFVFLRRVVLKRIYSRN
jgi:hypothetical protein